MIEQAGVYIPSKLINTNKFHLAASLRIRYLNVKLGGFQSMALRDLLRHPLRHCIEDSGMLRLSSFLYCQET